jgi:hypothetical protein
MTDHIDLDLRYLQAQLSRLDVLLGREVRRWQLAGQDPHDAFRGLYVSDDQAGALVARPFGTSWGRIVPLPPDEEQAFREAVDLADRCARSLADAARQSGHTLRLEHLATGFGLDRFDLDILLICLAPTLDLRYERLYGYLQDDVTRKQPTVSLVLDLLCEPGTARLTTFNRFASDAPLFRSYLLERVAAPDRPPLLNQALRPDEAVVSWLLGHYQPHTELGPHAVLSQPQDAETDRLLSTAVWPAVSSRISAQSIAVFFGPDVATQKAVARQIAAHAGKPLLTVNLAAVLEADVPPPRAVRLALRDARLTDAIPCLTGWDAMLSGGAPPADLLAEICQHPGLVILSSRKQWRAGEIERDRNLFWQEFPIPNFAQRHALWEHFLEISEPANERMGDVPDVSAPSSSMLGTAGNGLDVAGLAGQFLLTTSQIRDAVASARDAAAQRGTPLRGEDLFAAARVHSNPRLSSLARKIVPRYGWEDIVLPEDQVTLLHELVATVRGRPKVLEEWGVGEKLASSAGVTVLFAGPPGTGKTMAAEIIASELGLDLYKIDLSTVVSKYIGETEKNLERIFSEARTSNAILFFDEADALFGKRSEVRDSHDRYANIEISYLLQRMEAYDGVTILATNLRANLDEAFTRRLQFAVDFPFPQEEDRLRIWQTLFPPDVPRDPELDFGLLARRFKLAGGNIRNIIVSAAYLAASDGGRVTMGHLLHGTRRELQKMGRLIGEDDFLEMGIESRRQKA